MPGQSVGAALEWRERCIRPRIKPLKEKWSDGEHQAAEAGSDGGLIWQESDIRRLSEYGLGYLLRIALACERNDFSQARAEFEIFVPMLRKNIWFEEFERDLALGCPDNEDSRVLVSRVKTELIPDLEAIARLHEDQSYRAETEGWLRRFEKVLEQTESAWGMKNPRA
jgi:hypothetical protein